MMAAKMSVSRALSEPSLQTMIFIAICLQMVAVEKFQSNYDGAQERKRRKRETDTRAGEVLGEIRTDSGAQSSSGLHDESNHNIDIAFHRVPDRSVARRNDDLEQIGAHCDMGRYSQNIDHRRHSDVAGASSQKAAKNSTDERDEEDCPKRNRSDPR